MKLVCIESPYAGKSKDPAECAHEVERNLRYLDACKADCLRRGESPYASHGLLTQPGVLDDTIPEQRELGIRAGFAWGEKADMRAVYVDRGISSGMAAGIEEAERLGQDLQFRTLDAVWADLGRQIAAVKLASETFDSPCFSPGDE